MGYCCRTHPSLRPSLVACLSWDYHYFTKKYFSNTVELIAKTLKDFTSEHHRSLNMCITHWSRDKVTVIWQTTCSNLICSSENCCILFRISLKFVPYGPGNNKNQNWIRLWLGVEQATSQYLSQRWSCWLTHICVTRPWWVVMFPHCWGSFSRTLYHWFIEASR